MRKINITALAMVVSLAMAISAAALEYKTISRQEGSYAFADWTEVNSDVYSYTDLYVMETNAGTDIGLYICSYDMITGEGYCKSGYLFTQNDVFSTDRKLNSASLSAVDVEVYDWDTGTIETMKVSADWTATGDVTKGTYRYTSRSGDFSMKSSESANIRDATATGAINDVALGSSSYGSLVNFKSAYMEMRK